MENKRKSIMIAGAAVTGLALLGINAYYSKKGDEKQVEGVEDGVEGVLTKLD